MLSWKKGRIYLFDSHLTTKTWSTQLKKKIQEKFFKIGVKDVFFYHSFKA